MCLRRAPEKYITGAALDRAALNERSAHFQNLDNMEEVKSNMQYQK
jgi:hypothetical protein